MNVVDGIPTELGGAEMAALREALSTELDVEAGLSDVLSSGGVTTATATTTSEVRSPADRRWNFRDRARSTEPGDTREWVNDYGCLFDPYTWKRVAGDDENHFDPYYMDDEMPKHLVLVESGDSTTDEV